MKDHKTHSTEISFHEIDGLSVENAIAVLSRAAEGVVDPKIELESSYDGYYSLSVIGWVPMTEKEKERAKELKRRERERKAADKKAAEEAEKKELRRLVEKYPGVV